MAANCWYSSGRRDNGHANLRRIRRIGCHYSIFQPAAEPPRVDRICVWSCCSAPASMIAFLVDQRTLVAAFDDIVLFAVTRYSSIQYVPFGNDASIFDLPLLYVFPLAALLTLLVSARDWRKCLRDRQLWLCAAYAFAGFIGCFPRPDIGHIGFTVPLAFPMFATLCNTAYPANSPRISLRNCRRDDRTLRTCGHLICLYRPDRASCAGRADAQREGGVLVYSGCGGTAATYRCCPISGRILLLSQHADVAISGRTRTRIEI